MVSVLVDYDSLDSLTHALEGQDAVVSTISSTALSKQLLLVEAASKAHVKRFIPSEFGCNTVNGKCSALPCFRDKVAVQIALEKEFSFAGMTYTLIYTGPFLDWGIMVGFVMNVKGKSIDLFDGGDRLFSTTTLASIGKAVAGVLKHPEETKNRAVYVQDTATTMKKLLAMGKKAAGADGWKENILSTDELVKQGWVELQKPNPNPDNFVFQFIKAGIWGEGYGSLFENLDNELLGIVEMSDTELQALVSSFAK